MKKNQLRIICIVMGCFVLLSACAASTQEGEPTETESTSVLETTETTTQPEETAEDTTAASLPQAGKLSESLGVYGSVNSTSDAPQDKFNYMQITRQGEYLYFQYGFKSVHRIKDGSNVSEVIVPEQSGRSVIDISVFGETIYYLARNNGTDQRSLYQASLNGTNEKLLVSNVNDYTIQKIKYMPYTKRRLYIR